MTHRSRGYVGRISVLETADNPPVTPAVTVAEVCAVFGGRIVEAVDTTLPAGHVALFEAGRQRGFPWLRLRPGHAVGRGEDAWRAWLAGRVSPGDLAVARARLVRGEGIA